jgi:periplasmic divalent cation tolerance protein
MDFRRAKISAAQRPWNRLPVAAGPSGAARLVRSAELEVRVNDSQFCVVFITTAGPEEGRRVADALLEARVAACVNIVPSVESHYFWQGKRETGDESMLVVKTRADRLAALGEVVRAAHSYSVPEIIALPILWGSGAYLEWLTGELDRTGATP